MVGAMVDWDAGCYESTAAELEPVAEAVVDAAQPRPASACWTWRAGPGTRH